MSNSVLTAVQTALQAEIPPLEVLPLPPLFTPAAISWQADGLHIRVYHGDGQHIAEACWDGGNWSVGSFSAPGQSACATTFFDDGAQRLRVYVSNGNRTTEYCWNGNGWESGGIDTEGCVAGVTSWVDSGGHHVRLYTREAGGNVVEHCWDRESGWLVGTSLQARVDRR